MKGLFFIMSSTFLFGVFSGVYVYLQTQDSVSETVSIITRAAENNLTQGFEITADQFGACATSGGCVSYHVTTNGTFTQVRYSSDGVQNKNSGKLADNELASLVAELRATSFTNIPKRVKSCDLSRVTALRYIVRIADVTYRVNTCTESFSGTLAGRLSTF